MGFQRGVSFTEAASINDQVHSHPGAYVSNTYSWVVQVPRGAGVIREVDDNIQGKVASVGVGIGREYPRFLGRFHKRHCADPIWG